MIYSSVVRWEQTNDATLFQKKKKIVDFSFVKIQLIAKFKSNEYVFSR